MNQPQVLEELQTLYPVLLRSQQLQDERTQQSNDNKVGPSDIGFCRQKVALMVRGVERTDAGSTWPAEVGKAIHTRMLSQFKAADPQRFLTEDADRERMTVPITLPNGVQIIHPGHPDMADLTLNMCVDAKTVNGLGYVRRNGASTGQRFQRWLYTKGLLDAGVLDASRPAYCANMWVDRSGADEHPHFEVEEFDPALAYAIEEWISDVTYAVEHGEDASRDVAAPVCEAICEFYTACRGGHLPDEEAGLIIGEELTRAVETYLHGKELEKQGISMRESSASLLANISGIAHGHQVRWVEVNATEKRAGYKRLDIRPVR